MGIDRATAVEKLYSNYDSDPVEAGWASNQFWYLSHFGKTGIQVSLPYVQGRSIHGSHTDKSEIIIESDGRGQSEVWLYRRAGDVSVEKGVRGNELYRVLWTKGWEDERDYLPKYSARPEMFLGRHSENRDFAYNPPAFTTELAPFLKIKFDEDDWRNKVHVERSINRFKFPVSSVGTYEVLMDVLFDDGDRHRERVDLYYRNDRDVVPLASLKQTVDHNWEVLFADRMPVPLSR